MRRGLVHGLAWSLATGSAVTLAWWGVQTVMAGTAYDPPRTLRLPTDSATKQRPDPVASSTRRPESPTAKPSSPSRTPSAEPSETRRPSPRPSDEAPPPAPGTGTDVSDTGRIKGYTVEGGRVVFDLGETSAELVSATPDSGWQMQVWKQPSWIRVTFTQEGREVSVFCTWNGRPPTVEFDER
ncbi:hypothetical protein ACIOJD_07705 [Streptomyces sp. NPDC088116]|uniref:hypothetical protein n=1 Tax=Streptomyces sp. NPDC088116 TaxID=3365825 RepID=UPI0038068E6E